MISTVGMTGLVKQQGVLKVAKEAGVKLFVPAEWGDDSDERELPLLKIKLFLREEAKRLDLPFASFFNGQWSDYLM